MCNQPYLVDALETYSASALAASTVLRSLMGATISLAGRKYVCEDGAGVGEFTAGIITLVMLPFL